MSKNYHYEFDSIFELNKITYGVILPILKNAHWIHNVKYYLFESTTIQIYYQEILLDDHHYNPDYRIICDEFNFENNNSNKMFLKLFPGDITKSFSYLLQDNVPSYKVICNVKINTNPNMEDICFCPDNKLKPEIEGQFDVIEHIIN